IDFIYLLFKLLFFSMIKIMVYCDDQVNKTVINDINNFYKDLYIYIYIYILKKNLTYFKALTAQYVTLFFLCTARYST
ncbi:MAG: hypothetical protein MCS20_01750, partial [Candidatus Phytoplasma mali]|nr:hypothetical protein [Candidatus Phytoplasma australiense]MCG7202116.1 hypothetical protein [Candidatus Phytoplasma mali]MCZ8632415.1 hypothetical protein [Spiroplasma sp. Tabriz.8]